MAASRVGSNALFLAVKTLLASLLALVQVKLFAVHLSQEGFGLLLALRALAGLVAAVALAGLPQLALRFLPQLEARREGGRILRAAGLTLTGILAGYAVVGLAAWLGRDWLAGRFALAGAADALFRRALLVALAFGLSELADALWQGLRRMGPMALAEVLAAAGLTLQLFLERGSLDAARALELTAFWFLLRGGLLLAAFPLAVPRGGAPPAPLRLERGQLRDYWLLSLPLRWLALAYFDLDRYVVALAAALELVSLFNVPARLVGVSRRFLAAPVLSLQTEVSRFYEERREAELPERLQLFLRAQLVLSLWLAAALLLLSRPLILLVATPAYLRALPLMCLLLLSLPLSSLAACLEAAFRGLHGLHVVLLGNLAWALAYYGSLVILVRHLDLIGLGLAQVGAAALQAAWILAAARRRGWLAGLGGPLARTLAWGLAPLVPAILAARLLPGAAGWAPGPAGVAAGLGLLAAGAWLALAGEGILDGREKAWLLARLPLAGLRRGLARALRAGEAA
ncbi:MAG: hypothetical protein JW819_07480 [Candidatus Krumholzibacteriota bacterium]|nr:hypothetical protein [Candidatus Krumholzibacteriota bacterium]